MLFSALLGLVGLGECSTPLLGQSVDGIGDRYYASDIGQTGVYIV